MPAACAHGAAAPLAVGDLVGARGQPVEFVLDLLARRFQRRIVGVARHIDRFARRRGDAAERKIDGAAIPVVELDAPAGRHRHRVDRPAGMLRQLDDAEAGDARHLRHVGGERDIVAVLERREHFGEGGGAALAVEFAVMRARAADRLDAQLLGGARIDLAVAMARDQHLGAMARIVLFLDERHQEMLAVPHRDDRRRAAPCRRSSAGSTIERLLCQTSRRYHAPAVATAPWKMGEATIRLNDGISTCSAHRPARAAGRGMEAMMKERIRCRGLSYGPVLCKLAAAGAHQIEQRAMAGGTGGNQRACAACGAL